MLEATGGREAAYFHALAHDAAATVAWLESHGVAFCQPPYYLAAGPLRIQPVGGGRALVAALAAAATRLGVTIRYRCPARDIVTAERGGIAGVVVEGAAGGAETVAADAVILACGGFAADREMMRAHFGPGGETMRPISPGTHFNSGDGIRIGIAQGALAAGDWNGMHAEPVDPRAENSAPVVLVYPYGIVVDRDGRRFFDEGGGLVHETWEWFARAIQFETPGAIAFAILDSRLFDIAGFERAIRSEVAPFEADTLHELAARAGIDRAGLAQTVAAFNAAATGDPARFDPARCDGLATSASLDPPKSNWARADREAAVPRLSADRRRRLHLRRPRDRCAGARARRRGPAPGPLRGRRDHRPLLGHRAQCGVGAARAGVRAHRGARGDRSISNAQKPVADGSEPQAWPRCNIRPEYAAAPNPGGQFRCRLRPSAGVADSARAG